MADRGKRAVLTSELSDRWIYSIGLFLFHMDFEVIGRIVVDSTGAATLRDVSGELGNMQTQTGLLSSVTSAFGDVARYVWANIVLDGVRNAISAVGDFFRSTITSAEDSQNAITDLNAVLHATGGAAGMSSQQLQDMATSLQGVTRYSDETVLSGESMLLTFRNIGHDVFPQATEAVLDLAQKFGYDVPQAAVILGKALNDPLTGLTALHRIGIDFNDTQKEMIQHFLDLGDTASAQKIILQEVADEFGGVARAAGTTFAGQLDIAKNKIDDLKEGIGGLIIEALSPLVGLITDDGPISAGLSTLTWFFSAVNGYLTNGIPLFQALAQVLTQLPTHSDLIASLPPILQEIVDTLWSMQRVLDSGGSLADAFTTFFSADIGQAILNGIEALISGGALAVVGTALATGIGTAFASAIGEGGFAVLLAGAFEMPLTTLSILLESFSATFVTFLAPIGVAVMAVVGAFDLLRTGDLQPYLLAIQDAFAQIGSTFAGMLPFLQQTAEVLEQRFTAASRALAEEVIPFLVGKLQDFAYWFETNRPLIENFITVVVNLFTNVLLPAIQGFWEVIQPLLGGVIDLLLGLVTLVMQIATGDWSGAWETIKQIAVDAFYAIVQAVENLIEVILNIFGTNSDQVAAAIGNWVVMVQQWWDNLKTSTVTTFENIWTSITTWVENVGRSITEWATQTYYNVVDFFHQIGRDISDTFQSIKDAISTALNNIIDAIFAWLGINRTEFVAQWRQIWDDVVLIVTTIRDRIATILNDIATTVVTVLVGAFLYVRDQIQNVVDSVVSVATTIYNAIVSAFTSVRDVIANALSPVVSQISDTASGIGNAFSQAMQNAYNAIMAFVSPLLSAGRQLIQSLIDGISSTAANIVGAISNYFQMAVNYIQSHIAAFYVYGQSIIHGLINGIGEAAGGILTAITGAIQGMIDKVKNMLGIASPSTIFLQIGKDIIQGLIDGINAMWHLLTTAVGDVFDKIRNVFGDFLTKVQDIFTKIKQAYDDSGIAGIVNLLSGGLTDLLGGSSGGTTGGRTPGTDADPRGGTQTNTPTVIQNFYGPIYVGSMEELTACSDTNPLMSATGGQVGGLSGGMSYLTAH